MHDGRTRRVEVKDVGHDEDWLAHNRASLTLLTGPAAGSEYELDAPRMLIGRSASADLRLDDSSVSSEHAAIELGCEGFGIRDLASTNGVRVNGAVVLAAELKHGDTIELGEHRFHLLIEKSRREPSTYVLPDS